jgi:putative NADH-flavin reductase
MTHRVVIFGATGGTGREVLNLLLRDGHFATAVVRRPALLSVRHERLTVVEGDVLRTETFEGSIAGADTVVSCVGARARKPTVVYSQGVGGIVRTMNKHGIKRIVCISAGAVVVPTGASGVAKFFIKNILQRLFANLYSDMLIMEDIVEASDLNYTIIRAPWLRSGKLTRQYRVSVNEQLWRPSKISRADLAHYIVSHLSDQNSFRSKVEISY